MEAGVFVDPFGIEAVRWLAEHRSGALTAFFLFWTALGDVAGYVAVVLALHVAFDKRLALRAAVVVLAAMLANHLAKTLIANPRPFVADGTHFELWAVPHAVAVALAQEFSTPSGHAMAAAAFYGFLLTSMRDRALRLACVAAIVLIGASRPYLGVHYVEDVLLGWVAGLAIVAVAAWRGPAIARAWTRLAVWQRLALLLAASLALWIATRLFGGAGSEASAFLVYTGFLTGLLVAHPLEARRIAFDPRSGTPAARLARWALALVLVAGTLLVLGAAARWIAPDSSPLADALRFLRYAAAGFVTFLGAPLVFERLGLVAPAPPDAAAAR
ncbi:MAG TPA: phosphatase PAP2 family protein [Myxococcota bacterium]